MQVTLTDEQLDDLARRIAAQVSSRPDKVLYTEREAAGMLGVSPCSLRNWRCSGKIQAATRQARLYWPENIGKAVRFLEPLRQESIETTMRYYAGRNAQSTAEAMWDAHAKTKPQTENRGIVEESTFT